MTIEMATIDQTKDIRSVLTESEPERARYYNNFPVSQYRSIAALNPSSLAAGLIGIDDIDPCGIKLAWEQPESTAKTAASQDRLDRGTLAHLMVLQPELLMDRVAVWRGGRRASNEWSQFEDDNFGKLIVTAKDYHEVSVGVNAMRVQGPVADLFRGITPEVAMRATEPCRHGPGFIQVKGQVDAVNFATKTIVDLKTTEAGVDRRSVERTIRQFHYREKMALYRRWMAAGTQTDAEAWQCWNVFMSLTPPYGVVAVKFNSISLEWGQDRMLMALNSVEKCLHTNIWPMYCREMFMGVEVWEMDDGGDVDYAS